MTHNKTLAPTPEDAIAKMYLDWYNEKDPVRKEQLADIINGWIEGKVATFERN